MHLGLNKGDTVTGKKQRTPVQIDMEVNEADPQEFDALLIPGGYSPDNLRATRDPWNSSRNSWIAANRFLPFAMGQLLI